MKEKIGLLGNRSLLFGAMKVPLQYLKIWSRSCLEDTWDKIHIKNMVPSIKHGDKGVMMWGCFSEKGLDH